MVYGLQGTPYGGGGIETSTIIDLDHEVTKQDKTIYGDVELPIPGDASPVPPAVARPGMLDAMSREPHPRSCLGGWLAVLA